MSAFRFMRGDRSGSYSVHRGEQWLGHVVREVISVTERGVTRSRTNWRPSTIDGVDLASKATRGAAARALWEYFQRR